MTPAARVAAAIEILDDILNDAPAERVLTTWARQHRFAGSKDRQAIRDLVFDTLRQRNSLAHMGGGLTGRGLMIGLTMTHDTDIKEIFSGIGHAPAPLSDAEHVALRHDRPDATVDMPDWLHPALQSSLGPDFTDICTLMQHRAPVFLRVNTARTTLTAAQDALRADGIETHPHALAPTALEVTHQTKRIQTSAAYLDGLVELQDVASQAVLTDLPVQTGRVLDYCAGGGGKSLALAAKGFDVYAHDINHRRLQDIPVRAKRAGTRIDILKTEALAAQAPFDLVVVDAPCSGSGAWRRTPDAKWRLTPDRLRDLTQKQADILDDAAKLVSQTGALIYLTCSLLPQENHAQIDSFLTRNPSWACDDRRLLTPLDGGDGFFRATLRQN
ncbi:RsmB/NOP family class I SAM-dependent RNA methyltransferase [Pseudaestuariivita rosea]|uniref:RsmB/NOP family class I SAM-dependent RNA methyltransferase n=1 Tax=Pseudaestuariivita rosea TaxID=2763263 RepID=UPI001ABB1C06|nr:RsmB/NOP family class I SAM-dependent RNA methyltransferase [Pseudaestuariivita rosea]